MTIAYRMTTHDGVMFELDSDGAVVARTNGPKGWDYSGKWRILGFKKRYHSHHFITLEDAADGVDVGWGVVIDLDHGSYRQWMGPGSRLRRIERIA